MLLHELIRYVVLALITFILFGVLPAAKLAIILGLFVAVRLSSLAAEALRKGMTDRDWWTMCERLTRTYERLSPKARDSQSTKLMLKPGASTRQLAEARVRNAMRVYVPPRNKWELGAEGLGVIGFGILIPVDVALFTCDFFSLRTPQDWVGVTVAVGSVALYAWPYLWSKSVLLTQRRILWWSIPFLPALCLLVAGIGIRHPYLNVFHPDHERLAAERVLALKNNVVAGRHADWVMRFAQRLDQQGNSAKAIFFYREALRLDPSQQNAYARLKILEAHAAGPPIELPAKPVASSAPYWKPGELPAQAPRLHIDSHLEHLNECVVILVPIGDVAEPILNAVADVIHKELNLTVYVSDKTVPLPPYSRVRGLVTGRQWNLRSLAEAFLGTYQPFPRGPVKYLLVTPVDIYDQEENYLFSASYTWGGIVSFARFGNSSRDDPMLLHRTAKQSLCALLKSFDVPISPNRDCVTSYCRSLEEFDAKGNRPSTATLTMFRQAVAQLNNQWRQQRGLSLQE